MKNLRHAIGNSAFSPVQYKELKNSLVMQIIDELEKNKNLKWDVYNIGCMGK
jgi:predicted transport protein